MKWLIRISSVVYVCTGLQWWRSYWAIRGYLRTHPVRKVMIGAGNICRDGWLSSDLQPSAPGVARIDVTRRLPFANSTIDRIHCEHLLEHVSYLDGRAFLVECRRVLKPDGALRLATPDLDRILALAQPVPSAVASRYIAQGTLFLADRATPPRASFAINSMFSLWGHRFIYDEATLVDALGGAGFGAIARYEVGESNDPELRDLERHNLAIGEDFNRLETMVFEARLR